MVPISRPARLAAVCGPVLGAAVTHADLAGLSWRAAFLINGPLAVAVLTAGSALAEDAAPHRPRLDLPGTLVAIAGTALVTFPLIEARGWWTWPLLATGLALLVVFGLHQRARARRGAATLIETSLFAGRGFPAALATSTPFFAVVNGLMLVIVLHLQIGLGRDVLSAGLTLLPWSAGSAVASLAAGSYLVPRLGNRVLFTGLAVLSTGLAAAIAAYAVTRWGAGPCSRRWRSAGSGWGCSPCRSSPKRSPTSARTKPGPRPGCSTRCSSWVPRSASPRSVRSSSASTAPPGRRQRSNAPSGSPWQ